MSNEVFDDSKLKNFHEFFWQKRYQSGRSRWTSTKMLEFEVSLIEKLIINKNKTRILDLGCGKSEITRCLDQSKIQVTAMDNQPSLTPYYLKFPNYDYVCADLENLVLKTDYDLVLSFGLLSCIPLHKQKLLLEVARQSLIQGSVFVLKSQFSISGEAQYVDGFSSRLDEQYMAVYPDVSKVTETLRGMYSEVQTVEYPPIFQEHANTKHFALIARK